MPAPTSAALSGQSLHQQLSENRRWLRGLARSLVGENNADDLVQDVMEVALRKPPEVDRPIRPWLRRVLGNAARMGWRGGKRQQERDALLVPQDSQSSATETLQALQAHQALVRAVVDLAEPYRETVILRYVEGRSAVDIAQELGVSAATIRSRLHRGLALLRQQLDEDPSTSPLPVFLAPLMQKTPPPPAPITKGISLMKLAITLAAGIGTIGLLVSLRGAQGDDSKEHLGGGASPANGQVARAPMLGEATPGEALHAAGPGAEEPGESPGRAKELDLAPAQGRALPPAPRLGLTIKTYDFIGPTIWPGMEQEEAQQNYDVLDKNSIRAQLRASHFLISECYEILLEEQPEATGRLDSSFTIRAAEEVGGYVHDVETAGPMASLPGLNECIQETVLSLNFIAPAPLQQFNVSYNVQLEPQAPTLP